MNILTTASWDLLDQYLLQNEIKTFLHTGLIQGVLSLLSVIGHTAWQWTVAFTNCKLNEAFLTDAGGTAPLGLTGGCRQHIKAMKSQTVIITRLELIHPATHLILIKCTL